MSNTLVDYFTQLLGIPILQEKIATLSIATRKAHLAVTLVTIKAARLPLDRSWDCAIDPLPGTEPLRARVYPLYLEKMKAMEKHVEEAFW